MRPLARPADLLEELAISGPEEISVEAIAQYCRATVVYEDLDGCEAQILGKGDRAIITVKRGVSTARQRFSVAHELGHWMLDRGKLAAFTCSDRTFVSEWDREGSGNPERRANRFAAELLLPAKFFKADALGRDVTLQSVTDLAELYKTSFTATAIRLVELGPLPSMLVCTDQGRRRWFARGQDVTLWPVRELHAQSAAYDLLSGAAPVGPMEVAADLWIDHPAAARYVVVEDSRVVREFVLTLLWWKDQDQLMQLLAAEEDTDSE